MAANSKREQIIQSNIDIVEAVSSVKQVERTILQYAELENFAETQLPIIAVVGRIPVPVEKRTGRDGSVDVILSRLTVDLFAYLIANEDADENISNLMDDLWVALYANQRRNGLVISTEITPEEDVEYWAPYAAFKMSIIHRYYHTPGGI